MKKLLMLAVSVLAVTALVNFGVVGNADAKKKAATPMTTMGEVTAMTAGKNISVKDEKGKTHKFTISKNTKIDGEIKVGAKVDVTSKGGSAEEIKVSGGAEPAAAPMAPAPAPEAPKN